MKILGLPGRDQATVAWLQQLLSAITDGNHEVTLPSYRHWRSAQLPDPIHEADQVHALDVDLVVAKSMGTMVLLELLEKGVAPPAVVLIGVPLAGYSDAQTGGLKALVSRRPCLCIQQTDDFAGSYQQLAALLEGSEANLQEVSGSDHVYSDTAQLATLINAWLD